MSQSRQAALCPNCMNEFLPHRACVAHNPQFTVAMHALGVSNEIKPVNIVVCRKCHETQRLEPVRNFAINLTNGMIALLPEEEGQGVEMEIAATLEATRGVRIGHHRAGPCRTILPLSPKAEIAVQLPAVSAYPIVWTVGHTDWPSTFLLPLRLVLQDDGDLAPHPTTRWKVPERLAEVWNPAKCKYLFAGCQEVVKPHNPAQGPSGPSRR